MSRGLVNCCAKCGKDIPIDAKPNSEYVMLGMDYYHRPCYLEIIGVIV